MKRSVFVLFCLSMLTISFVACNDESASKAATSDTLALPPAIKEEPVTYTDNGITLHGFVAYDSNSHQQRPAVVIVHEWWGLNDYSKYRARELARLGYIAMALDLYGDGKTADNPDSAMKFALPFYQNPSLAQSRVEAGIRTICENPLTDTGKIAAIGYCFGGAMVLNVARLGSNLKGVVSFHGDLIGAPPRKDLLHAKILVCNGEADTYISKPDIALFKKQMDSIGADYTFTDYPGAIHSFTNPNSTKMGEKFKLAIAYQPAADTASWKDMQAFFKRVLK